MQYNTVIDGGVMYTPVIAQKQIVYLDFDGEFTSYNGEILTVDGVEVQNSNLTADRIASIVEALNTEYAAQNVVFVTEKPFSGEFSTVYIGKTDAFNQYGNFAGLAETIDENNQNHSDNAFVLLDAASDNNTIIEIISHETDHLLGILNHGGSGIAAYAANTIIGPGTTSTGLIISSWNSVTISSGGVANSTTVNSVGDLYVCSGGVANRTTVNEYGELYVSSGGVANSTTVNGGDLYVSSGGVANSTTVNGGDLYVFSGGVANSTTVNDWGYLYVSSGGVANSTTVNSGGDLRISSGGVANSTTVNYEGRLYVSSGGTANNTTVNFGGYLRVSSGGTANRLLPRSRRSRHSEAMSNRG